MTTEQASPPLVVMRIVHASQLVALALYAVVMAFVIDITRPASAAPATPHGSLLGAMVAVSAASLLAALWMRRKAAPWLRSHSQPDHRYYFTRNIAAWAMCQAIALCGILVSFVSKNLTAYYGFAAAAALALWLVRPRRRDLEAPAVRSGSSQRPRTSH